MRRPLPLLWIWISLLLGGVSVARAQTPEPPTRVGGWRLAEEESEYLREHAGNPVDWWPWGEEPFERAKAEDKPVFLSIGYSSCHWCHVMRRESFSDAEIARLLNESFICIKVDREELPHVDALYMDAVQLMTGRGGWPLSVFLTPEKKPFFGGTYFPPRRMGATIGFSELLTNVTQVWKERRGEIETHGTKVIDQIRQMDLDRGPALERQAFVDKGVHLLLDQYDRQNGGFSGAPKFPPPRVLVLLTALAKITDRQDLLPKVQRTLAVMAEGGLFDQVGGGFHRYTVDAEWSIPHFEKMLYSQGLLAEAYLEIYRMTREPGLEEIGRRTLDAMLRDFRVQDGGLAGSWDADSEEEEGTFYLWTPEQLREVLSVEEADLLGAYLGITEMGNFDGGRSVPSARQRPEILAQSFAMPPTQATRTIQTGLEKLFRARTLRVHPRKDPKVILGWNALAVSALARGSVILGQSDYTDAARQIFDFVDGKLARQDGFLRRVADGKAEHPAQLRDAAFHLKACLDLYEATLDPARFARAREIAGIIVRDYGPPSEVESGPRAFFDTPRGVELLVPRRTTVGDNALPSGNAVLAQCFLRLHALTGDASYRQHAEGIIDAGVATLSRYPQFGPEMMLATLMSLAPLPEVAVTGELRHPLTLALLKPVQEGRHPFAVLAHRPLGEAGERAAEIIPLLRDRPQQNGRPTAYLCFGFACQAPRNDPLAFERALQASWPMKWEVQLPEGHEDHAHDGEKPQGSEPEKEKPDTRPKSDGGN